MRLLSSLAIIIAVIAVMRAFGAVQTFPSRNDEVTREFAKALTHYEAGDWTEAHQRMLKLARGGHANAEAILGAIYAEGQGVEQNYPLSAIWFYRSARRGYAAAQLALGTLYYYGRGVRKDPADAYRWFLLAAKRGDARVAEEAKSWIARTEGNLTREVQDRLREDTDEWRPIYALTADFGLRAADEE